MPLRTTVAVGFGTAALFCTTSANGEYAEEALKTHRSGEATSGKMGIPTFLDAAEWLKDGGLLTKDLLVFGTKTLGGEIWKMVPGENRDILSLQIDKAWIFLDTIWKMYNLPDTAMIGEKVVQETTKAYKMVLKSEGGQALWESVQKYSKPAKGVSKTFIKNFEKHYPVHKNRFHLSRLVANGSFLDLALALAILLFATRFIMKMTLWVLSHCCCGWCASRKAKYASIPQLNKNRSKKQ